MATLCDDIEAYLKRKIRRARDGIIELRRSELADQFSCVPSQITYVLDTRFTPERGYVIESRRGGGGYIRIERMSTDSASQLLQLMHERSGSMLDQERATDYIARLREEHIISASEGALMEAAVDRQTLGVQLPQRDAIRARVFKNMLLALLSSRSGQRGGGEHDL